MVIICNSCNAQSQTVYRQTLIIKSGKPTELITWQKITINYLDVIFQYDLKGKKRREVYVVFGREPYGVSAKTDWVKYEFKEGDTLYNYKRSL